MKHLNIREDLYFFENKLNAYSNNRKLRLETYHKLSIILKSNRLPQFNYLIIASNKNSPHARDIEIEAIFILKETLV